MKYFALALTLSLSLFSTTLMADDVPAFPGAEGHGRYVTGGRGKTVVHVTNLNDSGTGSFRQAVSSANRIVVFDVAGVIALKSNLSFKDNITILGQTAPYPGITLRYYTVQPGANNIIRFIRFRRGQEKDINDGADACWQRNKTGIIFDHCSFSWSIDEVASFYDNNNFTMQWCTIGESLVDAGHGKGAHGYGGIWGGKLASFHHNMILHVANRSPRFNGARYNWAGYTSNKLYSQYQWQNAVQSENVDFRNCVVYNTNGCYGGPGGGQINMVGNYYKSGPAATIDRLTTVSIGNSGNAKDNSIYWDMTSRYFLDGNMIDGNNAGWNKMRYDSDVPSSGGTYYTRDPNHYYGEDLTYTKVGGVDCLPIPLDAAAPTGEVTTHTAATAFDKVLGYAGASLYRDEVDERYANEASSGTTTYMGTVTKKPGLIDLVSDCNGYTEANFPTGSRDADFDTDQDGIPDEWETANGLNPNDKSDGNAYTLDTKGWYTNLEVYASSLVEDIMKAENKDALSSVDEYYPPYARTGIQGDIKWAYDGGTLNPASTIDDNLAGTVTTQVTVGSNLTANGTLTTNDNQTLTAFTCSSKDTEAGDQNAVVFNVTPVDGYTFQPTSVSFKVARNKESSSTAGGKFAAYWRSADGSTKVIQEATLAERCNRQPYVTEVKADISGVQPTTGTSALVVNLFNFATNMPMGISDVVINGKLSATTAISTATAAREALSVEYYSLQGAHIHQPDRGLAIQVTRYSDGTKQARKVIIR